MADTTFPPSGGERLVRATKAFRCEGWTDRSKPFTDGGRCPREIEPGSIYVATPGYAPWSPNRWHVKCARAEFASEASKQSAEGGKETG